MAKPKKKRPTKGRVKKALRRRVALRKGSNPYYQQGNDGVTDESNTVTEEGTPVGDNELDSDGDGIPDDEDENNQEFDTEDPADDFEPSRDRPERPERLIDTEARKDRIKTYDTTLTEGVEGKLPEATKSPTAEAITDAGSGTKSTIEERTAAEAAQVGQKTVIDYEKVAKETKVPKGFVVEWRPDRNAFFVQPPNRKPQMLSPEEYADFFNVDYEQYTTTTGTPVPTELATVGTAKEARLPGEYNLDFIRLAALEKLPKGVAVRVRDDGRISVSVPGRPGFIYTAEEAIENFGLEGDFGGPTKAEQVTASTLTDAEGLPISGTATAATQTEVKDEVKATAATIGDEEEPTTITAPTGPEEEEIQAAKATAPTREEESVTYATAQTEAEKYGIDLDSIQDPTVKQRTAQTISEREEKDLLDIVTKEGINLEDVPEFNIAKQRTAQVGVAAQGIAQQLGEVPSVDLQGRRAITGQAPQGDAAQIGGVPTLAASQMQAVTGVARSTAAADMMAVVGNMPPEITAAISEDPATVEAQIANETLEVKAAVAALPEEALVSVQMEKLLEGMEEGKTPAWARPAVAAVEQQMARRGLTTSTVGRDALFNAIIQSALPMAQSNAQALQQNAQQNLSNQQQANLASAQNTMQIRLANLSNEQTAASQTAQMAQQIKVQQAQFRQEAVLTTAQQEQQVRMQNIQSAQQRASQESSQRQQVALANLDAGARMDLANLEALNIEGRENLNATQQTRLASYQANVNRIMRQAELTQDMEKANLDVAMRMELTNLAEQNAAARDTMSIEQQERLVNLQTLVDFKKTNASLAQQMDMANMSNVQQMELANLTERAATDSANFTEANRFRLQELTTFVNIMSQNEQLRLNAELAQLSASEKVSLANLTAKNQADSESMSATNVANLQSFEKRMQAAQVNAQLAQQLGLANLSNEQQAAMFNAQINAGLDMKQFDFEQQAEIANSRFMQTLTLKNLDNEQQAAIQTATLNVQQDLAQADLITKVSIENSRNFLQRDLTNLKNEQQASILNAQLRQQTLLSDQAAENAAQQFNAKSQNEINVFMTNVAKEVELTNKAALNSMEQFNANAQNAAEARDAARLADFEKFNASLKQDITKFSEQIQFNRDSWNAQNAAAVEAADIADKRRRNEIDTATQNAINMQNASNAFKLSTQSLAFLNQEMRDQADHEFKSYESAEARAASIVVAALGAADNTFDDNKWTAALRSEINILLGLVG